MYYIVLFLAKIFAEFYFLINSYRLMLDSFNRMSQVFSVTLA